MLQLDCVEEEAVGKGGRGGIVWGERRGEQERGKEREG